MDPANGFWEDHADIHSLDLRALEFLYFVWNCVCNNHLQKEKKKIRKTQLRYVLHLLHLNCKRECPPTRSYEATVAGKRTRFYVTVRVKIFRRVTRCYRIERIHGYQRHHPSPLSFCHMGLKEGTKISPTLRGTLWIPAVCRLAPALVSHCYSLRTRRCSHSSTQLHSKEASTQRPPS